ncbi:MAG: DUF3504 domain-containing protein [Proteobacteria bacterium]|nr:DUF3504 domain-containing protein [Pseudomonadota bacterium]
MKKLQSAGVGSVKKEAEPLTMEEEEQLWEKKILGDHSPIALLNAMMFMNGLYFALQSRKFRRESLSHPQRGHFKKPSRRIKGTQT